MGNKANEIIRHQEARLMLTAKEAAIYLSCSTKSLAQWRCQGRGPPFYKRGRITYCLSDLNFWMDGGAATSTAQAKLNKV